MTLPSEVNPLMLYKKSTSAYSINNSLRFRASASAYLSRTFGTPTNQSVFTFSAWLKRGKISTNSAIFAESAVNSYGLFFDPGDTLSLYFNSAAVLTTTAVFRDPSSWYHIIWTSNGSTQTIYVNNASVASVTASQTRINSAIPTYIMSQSAGSIPTDGYMAEVNFIDGQALTPTSFGAYNSTTGVWEAKAYSGSYGTNGFYLKFANTSSVANLGLDSSGNNNTWTVNNVSLTAGTTYDAMIDVPPTYSATSGTQPVGNYCVLNPLDKDTARGVLDYANLRLYYPSFSSQNSAAVRGTIGVTSGKWYFEDTNLIYAGSGNFVNSVFTTSTQNPTGVGIQYGTALSNYIGTNFDTNGAVVFVTSGYSASLANATTLFGSYASGDIINTAIDLDNGQIWIGKNGTWYNSGNPATGTNPTSTFTSPSGINRNWVEAGTNSGSSNQSSAYPNYGQRPFSYAVPSGFSALCSSNLSSPTIANGAQYMAATLYTGTGATQTINDGTNTTLGTTFQPDLVWIKSRSATTNNNLFDSVRTATNYLISNSTNTEATDANSLTAFGATGFTLGSDAGSIGVNINTNTYVGWQWKAGGTGVSNTSGSITSTVSANTSAGFSVVTYTGTGANATVGHGLGVTPSMIITKRRTTFTSGWGVWHTALAATEYLLLNTTDAKATAATAWNSTLPTSTVFSVGNASFSNGSVDGYVAYCFAPVAGYSAFGSYTGNGSTDGPFVYTGFRPRFVLIKRITGAIQNWVIEDSSRDTYNVDTKYLLTDSSAAEGSDTLRDLLSNGFKIRSANQNNNGDTFIYAAFAENPFKYSRAR